MSVTRKLFFLSSRTASSISFASRAAIFLFHMPRSSIHSMPNCLEATSQAWPKSCEISSLMTAILNGDLLRDEPEVPEDEDWAEEREECAANMLRPATNPRREISDRISILL